MSANQPANSAVTFDILSGGSPIPASVNIVLLSVEKRLNHASEAKFILSGGDAESITQLSSGGLFAPGATIVIQAGYHGVNRALVKGNVAAQWLKINNSALILTV